VPSRRASEEAQVDDGLDPCPQRVHGVPGQEERPDHERDDHSAALEVAACPGVGEAVGPQLGKAPPDV
jgi:hypothetical protein